MLLVGTYVLCPWKGSRESSKREQLGAQGNNLDLDLPLIVECTVYSCDLKKDVQKLHILIPRDYGDHLSGARCLKAVCLVPEKGIHWMLEHDAKCFRDEFADLFPKIPIHAVLNLTLFFIGRLCWRILYCHGRDSRGSRRGSLMATPSRARLHIKILLTTHLRERHKSVLMTDLVTKSNDFHHYGGG